MAGKARPVSVGSIIDDCAHFFGLKTQKKQIEQEQNAMKERLLAAIPKGQTTERFAAMRDGKRGNYVITRVEQDRRVADPELLRKKLEERGLFARASKVVPDEEKVAKLIEQGKFSTEDLAACLVGTQPIYPLIDWEPQS